jgi:hypothetical protein
MNNKKLVAFVLVGLLAISAFAFGETGIQKIEAYLVGDLNFEVDGEAWMPTDVDGSPMTPVIYQDRTYVPARALLEDKGVTVGYEADTRTVLIDYSTMKPIDKASPLLFDTVRAPNGSDDQMAVETVELSLNPNYEPSNLAMTKEFNLELKEEAKIYIDGRMMDTSLEELYKSEMNWSMKSMEVMIDQETGLANEVRINTLSDSEADQALAAKLDIDVDVKISYPPFKVTIVISF